MGKPITPAERTLDKWFGKYIRALYSPGPCITCGKWLTYETAECGHFITRDKHAVRWEIPNAHIQCTGCNGPLKGNQYIHGLRVDEMHGKGTAELLRFKANHPVKFQEWEIRDMIDKFRKLFNALKKEKGL